MKNMLLLLFILGNIGLSYSQTNFQWEKIDSVNKSKAQIYSDTKMFIAEVWKSANSVIQNDDKESGLILVKGSTIKTCFYMLNNHDLTYSYTIKFSMKDKKYRIQICDVINTSHTCRGNIWKTVDPVDNFEGNQNLGKNVGNNTFNSIKSELQQVFDAYIEYIKKPGPSASEW